MSKTAELYEEQIENGPKTQEEILMNETELLQGLLDSAKARDDKSFHHRVDIKRKGVLKFSFRIRPLSEDEYTSCLKNATKFSKPKKFGEVKVPIETNRALHRSYLIYNATVDEDREKIWDNKKAQNALNILTGVDMIDTILLAGEKDSIVDLLDDISGFNSDMEEEAKN